MTEVIMEYVDFLTDELITEEPLEKNSFRGVKRKKDYYKARRKYNILKHIQGWSEDELKPVHYYSKNKVHCSCPLCAADRKLGYVTLQEMKEKERVRDMMKEDYEE